MGIVDIYKFDTIVAGWYLVSNFAQKHHHARAQYVFTSPITIQFSKHNDNKQPTKRLRTSKKRREG